MAICQRMPVAIVLCSALLSIICYDIYSVSSPIVSISEDSASSTHFASSAEPGRTISTHALTNDEGGTSALLHAKSLASENVAPVCYKLLLGRRFVDSDGMKRVTDVLQENVQKKLLGLKNQMKLLTLEQARHLKSLGVQAKDSLKLYVHRRNDLQQDITKLKNQAETLRIEASERKKLANKMFERAETIGTKAAAIQRESFISKYGTDSGPSLISSSALKLLRNEAFRIGEVLRNDAENLRNAQQGSVR
eukprot:CAMPEP_0113669120 /NCGR_PEP_ID=MMETSP0038_2-20120614/4390_1 /TAXON_ID=2898 /ORGANISM="Cryptomonas paramecium" /LENGTH=249 /DNA_ID=CAMNT_0000584961 /DNA_START=17 /DNA_END=767 /DNA_ORIENTATION=+ /assembly_acc=CAM_ASM_000170